MQFNSGFPFVGANSVTNLQYFFIFNGYSLLPFGGFVLNSIVVTYIMNQHMQT
jgi:hypothetical protein